MQFSSPYTDVDIPDDLSFPQFVLGDISSFANKPALIDGPSGRSYSFSDIKQTTQSFARGLHHRGFSKGDVFAIYCPNVPEYAVIFFGVAMLGGINTTINPLYTSDELAHQLKDTNAKFLITVPPFLDKAREAAAQSGVEEVFVIGEAGNTTSYSSLLLEEGVLPQVVIDPSVDLIVIPYSSGTTGLPKGVMLTHGNLIANLAQIQALSVISEKDTVAAILPFFHIFGMIVVMAYGLSVGATLVTMPKFDLEQFLQLLQDHQVTRTFLVPPIVVALAKHPVVDQYDLANLNMILCGAAPLSKEVTEACRDRLGCIVAQGYGMTEMSPVTNIDERDSALTTLGSIGPLLPNTEAMIVDVESGEPLGPNQQGEYWVRGPQRMTGYLHNEKATSDSIDADGWYHSGDIAYIDDDGRVFIVDRLKELIKYKGMQVAPAELEAILLSHDHITDAAVVPQADEEAGEIPKAFVVTDSAIDSEEVMTFVAGQVAPHKKIRAIEFTDSIPKSPSGKILRRFLIQKG